jgi:hypothetical protein
MMRQGRHDRFPPGSGMLIAMVLGVVFWLVVLWLIFK